jgi:hypothetical protein
MQTLVFVQIRTSSSAEEEEDLVYVGGLAAVGSGDIRMHLPSVAVRDEAEAEAGAEAGAEPGSNSNSRTVGVTIVNGGFRDT